MTAFDLRNEPWIPCLSDKGTRQTSLVEVLNDAHEIREIVGESPPITIALHRLLLAVLHRVFKGPKNAEAWNDLYTRGSFDSQKIKEYFDRHHDRFDLFHEKYPFYQAASAREFLQQGSAIQLYFQGKNNSTLFDHTSTSSPKELCPAEAARLVVAFQAFDFGGTKADGSAQTAPLLQSAIALIRGQNLFETLLLNLHRYDGTNASPFVFDEEKDMPAWERVDETHKAVRWPDGPIDLMTWQPRRLAIEAVEVGDGSPLVRNAVIMLGYAFPEGVDMQAKETMMAFRMSSNGQMFSVGFSEKRALWRNSGSLLETNDAERSRPRVLDWVNELKGDRFIGGQKLPVDFYGLAADKGKLLFWNHERFDLPLVFLDDRNLIADLNRCLEFAEKIGSALRSATKALADELETERGTFVAEGNYWSLMESRFHTQLDRMPLDTKLEMKSWFADTLHIAHKALSDTLNSLSGTAAENRASVLAENKLWKTINVSVERNRNAWHPYLPVKLAARGGN